MTEPEPIWIICEGSGAPVHPLVPGLGMCSMCGRTVDSNQGIALLHKRDDILARVQRGDFG